MNEHMRESLSALMDDTADDLELARVLQAMDENSEVSAAWSRFHLVRAVLQGVNVDLMPGRNQIRRTGMMVADAAPADETRAPGEAAWVASDGVWSQRRRLGWASFAVAATVTLAITVAVEWRGDLRGVPQVTKLANAQGGTERVEAAVAADLIRLNQAPVDTFKSFSEGEGSAQLNAEVVPRFKFPSNFPEQAVEVERQVDAYMLSHTEFTAANANLGTVPFARYAAFEDGR